MALLLELREESWRVGELTYEYADQRDCAIMTCAEKTRKQKTKTLNNPPNCANLDARDISSILTLPLYEESCQVRELT